MASRQRKRNWSSSFDWDLFGTKAQAQALHGESTHEAGRGFPAGLSSGHPRCDDSVVSMVMVAATTEGMAKDVSTASVVAMPAVVIITGDGVYAHIAVVAIVIGVIKRCIIRARSVGALFIHFDNRF